MARINVDEEWFKDPRRDQLALVLSGPLELADGAALALWRLGQSYWQNDRNLVPLRIWSHVTRRRAYEDCGLVELREDGVYVRGAIKHFDWLHSRTEAGRKGGEAGANRPRDAQGHYLPGAKTAPSKHQAKPKQTPSNAQANTKLTQASSSSSSSSSIRNSVSNETVCISPEKQAGPERPSGTAVPPEPPPSPLAEVWNRGRMKLAEVRRSNQARDRKAYQRWREHTPEVWAEVIERVAKSDFCNGQNDRGWRATFDWLLQPDSALRVLEGKYDNPRPKNSAETFAADYQRIFGDDQSDD